MSLLSALLLMRHRADFSYMCGVSLDYKRPQYNRILNRPAFCRHSIVCLTAAFQSRLETDY